MAPVVRFNADEIDLEPVSITHHSHLLPADQSE